MGKKLEHAIGLYMEGIRDGNMKAALDAYVGDRYTQHSTGVADGKEGFMAFFGPFLERNPVRHIQVARAIEDGQYVFVHVFQSLNDGAAKWVTADLFDTDDNDRMIEHWDVIQEFAEETTRHTEDERRLYGYVWPAGLLVAKSALRGLRRLWSHTPSRSPMVKYQFSGFFTGVRSMGSAPEV